MTTDLIRCQECGSIDPILYSNRIVCCELVSIQSIETHQLTLVNSRFRWDSVKAQLMRQCHLD